MVLATTWPNSTREKLLIRPLGTSAYALQASSQQWKILPDFSTLANMENYLLLEDLSAVKAWMSATIWVNTQPRGHNSPLPEHNLICLTPIDPDYAPKVQQHSELSCSDKTHNSKFMDLKISRLRHRHKVGVSEHSMKQSCRQWQSFLKIANL